MENFIITQADVQPVQTLETLLAANLFAHANASLSKAHGMEFLCVPSPFFDAGGNDVSHYLDSNGDIVGYYQMRITDPGTLTSYYVPLNSTSLPGQAPLAGIATTADAGAGTQTDSAWVTEFPAGLPANLAAANTQLLLPHTGLSHWETHTAGVYSILPQDTFDSAGHLVGDYVAKISFNGEVLLVPCSSRRGGPAVTPQIITITPSLYHVNSAAGQTYVPTVVGTQPCTYAWYNSALGDGGVITGNWSLIPPVAAPATSPVVFGSSGQYLQVLNVQYDATTGNLRVVSGGGGGQGTTGWFRLVVTNASGSTAVYSGTSNYAMVYWNNGFPTD